MCTDEENTPPVEFTLSVQSAANADIAVYKVWIPIPLALGFFQRRKRHRVPGKAGAVAPSCGRPGPCTAPAAPPAPVPCPGLPIKTLWGFSSTSLSVSVSHCLLHQSVPLFLGKWFEGKGVFPPILKMMQIRSSTYG